MGDAGYMVLPPLPPEDNPPLNHVDDGSHGVDFVLNLQDPNIAFGTVQLCTGPLNGCVEQCCNQACLGCTCSRFAVA